ncbi:MAG: hypothetical protein AB7O67_22880, partial [Vicinamibacterales bacterium]
MVRTRSPVQSWSSAPAFESRPTWPEMRLTTTPARGRVSPLEAIERRVMAKEKFDRSKPHVNVGTIGHIDHG